MAAEAGLARSTEPAPPPVAHAAPRRDLRLDACRGLALWCIFLDHVPDNIGSWVTLQHVGFSDTTEVFMFVSGFTCAMAYGEVLRAHGWSSVVAHTLRRSFEIYIAFLMLVLACVTMAYVAGGATLDDSNTRILLEQPGPTLVHALILQYRPVNSDVLPTFVLFHAAVAPLLLCLRRAPNFTLAASAALYVLTRVFDWNIPQWPRNDWYFNPFAWQVLFVFGAWWATYGGARLWPMIRNHVPVLAIIYLLFSLVVALGWSIEALGALVPEALAKLIYPIDKSGLDPLRLLHFLALAVVVSHFVPRDWLGFAHRDVAGSDARPMPVRRDPLAIVLRAAIRCGENSLSIYCFGVLLSLAGGIALARIDSGIAMQIAVSVAGIAAMGIAASLLTWVRSKAGSTRRYSDAALDLRRWSRAWMRRAKETRVSAYDPLRDYLLTQTRDDFVLSLEQLEEMLGFGLPRASQRASWWETGRSPQVEAPQRVAVAEGGFVATRLPDGTGVRFLRARLAKDWRRK